MAPTENNSNPEFRLPKNVIPLHYDLNIITHLEDEFTFEGDIKIKIKCLEPTDSIVLHSRSLNIKETLILIAEESKIMTVKDTSFDTNNDFYIIKTEALQAGQEYVVKIAFTALLGTNLVGYYYSSYQAPSGKKKYLAVTHFEPSDARQAFPCFDEPALKATFQIRLGHKDNFKAISNMPVKSSCPIKSVFSRLTTFSMQLAPFGDRLSTVCVRPSLISDILKYYSEVLISPPAMYKGISGLLPYGGEGMPGYVWTEFENSLTMSTYLVAYMVSEFKSVESEQHPSNVTFRVWARPDALDQAAFSASVGPKFLSFYEDFFGVKYPLPKQDLLAIPDFKIGAMENWGIITFRESSLLLDEQTVSATARLHIASITAHELAHMWFGNLVTMRWWTDLWLKEGFATFMAGVAVHHEFPEWNSLDAEALSDLLEVFHLDSLKSSHPVSVPIGHSNEISQIFDTISYVKGSFLIRMMTLFLGEEVFRHGLSNYLKKHEFSNAEQDDLWESFTEQAHRYNVLPRELTVKQIMDTWTLQTGYPIITVTRQYDNNKAVFTQKRFLANESENQADYNGSWWVPLSYSSEKEPNFHRTQPEDWLHKNKESTCLDVRASQDEWLIVNNRAAGLYKVNYDNHNWTLVSNCLHSEEFEKIDVMNRAVLIVDSMDLADCGIITYDIAFLLLSYVEKERSFAPWNAALTKLDPIRVKLCRTPIFGAFKDFIKSLMTPVVKSLGLLKDTPSSFEKARLMNLISQWALPLKIGNFNEQSEELFNIWLSSSNPDDDNPVPREVRWAVYSNAVHYGGEEVFSFLWKRYKAANVVTEKNNILRALTNTQQVFLLNKYLEMTLSEASGIRKQDAFIIFKMVAKKELGFYVAHKFFLRNIERISEYFGVNSNLIGHYFAAIAEQMTYMHEYEELRDFSIKYEELLAPASLTVKQSLETVLLNVKWLENNYSHIGETMKKILSTRKSQ